jgi:excinuclease ABC subunit C
MTGSLTASLETKLAGLPESPGVYIFRDKKNGVLYVGKAKSLKHRVRSYFQEGSSDTRSFIHLLPRLLGDLETIVTLSEKEAAILENTLIKEHQPKFNVKLRDDKSFLLLKVQKKEPWARLRLVRKIENDGAKYFGPFHSATSARRTLTLVNKHFQLRTCSDQEMKARKRPCLQHQIKRCPAPCVLEVDADFYREQVDSVLYFLGGRHDELSALLVERMKTASEQMRFELAVVHRDQLRAVEKVRELQRVVSSDLTSRDVLGFYREGDLCEVAILQVRGGKLADVATCSIKDVRVPDDEMLSSFITFRYLESEAYRASLPSEVVLPLEIEGAEGLALLVSETSALPFAFVNPKRGKKTELLAMAQKNAEHGFREKRRQKDDALERLADLKDRLRLPELPRRIECCDMSHLGGEDSVGAIVAMNDGELDKSRYRSFHVRSSMGAGEKLRGGDDYGSMYQVLARRFRRAQTSRTNTSEDDGAWRAPDLLVVDGGRGQLNVALAAARDLGLDTLSIVAIAKEKENAQGVEVVDRIYVPGQKNAIPVRASASLLLLARLRDEAHRFSNKARERLGRARRFASGLDGIPGVGPKAKKALLGALGSSEKVGQASDQELLAIPGIHARHVKALREVLMPAHALDSSVNNVVSASNMSDTQEPSEP